MNSAPIPSPETETKSHDSAPVSHPLSVTKWGRMLVLIIAWLGLLWCGPLAMVCAFNVYGLLTGFPAPENTLSIMVKMCLGNALAAALCFFCIVKLRGKRK